MGKVKVRNSRKKAGKITAYRTPASQADFPMKIGIFMKFLIHKRRELNKSQGTMGNSTSLASIVYRDSFSFLISLK